MKQDLIDSLDMTTQPDGLRSCHDVLGAWIQAFQSEPNIDLTTLSTTQKRRLGYLVSAARLMGGLEVHRSWRDFELQQRPLAPQLRVEPLWACDDEPNAHDALAQSWGLSRGVRIATLKQIIQTGSF